MRILAKNNFAFLLVGTAILVGLLYATPQFLIWRHLTNAGQPFILNQFTEFNDEGYYYLQSAREAYDGHIPPRDFFFDRDEQRPTIFNPLSPIIFSSFIHLTGDINTAYILANFILPPILFFIFYVLGLLIFDRKRWWSLFFSFVALITPIALNVPAAFFGPENFANIVLKNFYPGVQTLLPRLFWSRIDYPMVTHLIYLPAIIFFMLFWKRPRTTTALLAGIFAGLLFYTYFHFWTFWLAVLSLTFLYTLIILRNDRERIKKFLWLLISMAILAIPYFIRYFQFKAADITGEFTSRMYMEVGRIFRWEEWPHYLFYLLIAFLVYQFLWRKNDRNLAIFLWASLISAIIALNAQLFVGFNVASDHWPRALSPLIYSIIFLFFYKWIKNMELNWPIIKKITAAIFIIAVALSVVKKTVNIFAFNPPPKEISESYTLPQEIVESWQWINHNIGDEPKIISPSFVTAIYLPAFTAARPYLAWSIVAPLTNFEIEEIYLKTNKIFGVSASNLEKRLRGGKGLICEKDCDKKYNQVNIEDDHLNLYNQYFKNQGLKQIPEEKISELLSRYREIKTDWGGVNAQYAYFGPWERQFTDIDLKKEKALSLIFENSTVQIYKIIK